MSVSLSRSGKAPAFTIIEMLTVMAVIVIIITVATPAIKGLGAATGLNGAGNEVENLLNVARQNSLTKGVLTAVVVLGDPSAGNSAFRTVTLLQLAERSDGQAATSADWRQIESWRVLPTGIIVDNQVDVGTTNGSSFLQPNTFQPSPPSLRYNSSTIAPAQAVGTTGYYYQVFLPNGTLYQAPSPCSLRLVAGSYTGTTPIYTGKQADYYTLICTDATGEIKILRP